MEIHPPASQRRYTLTWYRFQVEVFEDEEHTRPLKGWPWKDLVASTEDHLCMHIDSLLEPHTTDLWYTWKMVEENVSAPPFLIEGGGH